MVSWISRYPWFTLIEVNPGKLLEMAVNTREGFSPKDEKLIPLIERLSQGRETDASIVGQAGPLGKELCFAGDRHGTTAAIALGFPAIKIAVSPEEAPYIQSVLS